MTAFQPSLSSNKMDSPAVQVESTPILPEDLEKDAQLLEETFLPPSYSVIDPSQAIKPYTGLPFCLPQTGNGLESPFERAVPATNELGIGAVEMLQFADGLNLAFVASPPLRIVDKVGMVVGFIPDPFFIAMAVGTVMQTGAQTAIHVISKTLTDRYLRASNERLFNPKGLAARICTTEAMLALIDPENAAPAASKLDKFGRVVGGVLLALPIPFSSRIVRAIADKPPAVNPNFSTTSDAQQSRERYLAIVKGISLSLSFNVPPINTKDKGVLEKMNKYAYQIDAFKKSKSAAKLESNRRQLAYAQQAPTDMLSRREWKTRRKMDRRAAGGRGGLLSGLIGPKESKLERKVNNAALKESWKTKRLLWVVILAHDQDSKIDGVETEDSKEDIQYIKDADLKNATEREEKDRAEFEAALDDEDDDDEDDDVENGRG